MPKINYFLFVLHILKILPSIILGTYLGKIRLHNTDSRQIIIKTDLSNKKIITNNTVQWPYQDIKYIKIDKTILIFDVYIESTRNRCTINMAYKPFDTHDALIKYSEINNVDEFIKLITNNIMNCVDVEHTQINNQISKQLKIFGINVIDINIHVCKNVSDKTVNIITPYMIEKENKTASKIQMESVLLTFVCIQLMDSLINTCGNMSFY